MVGLAITICVITGASKPVVNTSQLQRILNLFRLKLATTCRRVASRVLPLITADAMP